MSATLSRRVTGRWRVVHRLREFGWEDMPLLTHSRGKTAPDHPFRISIHYSDGRELIMDCRPGGRHKAEFWLVG